MSISLKTQLVQAVGVQQPRCQWWFDIDDRPLVGDHVMLQTVLVERRTSSLTLKMMARANVRTNWTDFIGQPEETEWVEVRIDRPAG